MSPGRSRPAPAGAGVELSVAVEDDGWAAFLGEDPEAVAREALDAVERRLGFARAAATEVSATFTGDAAVQALNREWRGKDRPTNILSFPMAQLAPGDAPGPLLGDLVLALETCRREAGEEGKRPGDHVRHLLVHGTLHLLGHDHEDDAAAERMEALEREVLATLGIADPYAELPAAAADPFPVTLRAHP